MFGVAEFLSTVLGADSYPKILGGGALSGALFCAMAYRFSLDAGERGVLREQVARRLGR